MKSETTATNAALRAGATSTIHWTPEQRRIIEAPATSRILVDAGPGTGKTATACARIAWLLTEGEVDASEIWLFSFTRTAVHELRTRIATYLPDPALAHGLRIATIDSHAWSIHAGFDTEAALSGSIDDNIQRVIELVREHEGVFAYVGSVRHLVVDEAQDVIGLRCTLILEFINALPESAGVSVFADEAQAIYGFAEDGSAGDVDGTLPDNIRRFMREHFRDFVLEQVHRTEDRALLALFSNGRKVVRDQTLPGEARLQGVRDLVNLSNHGAVGAYWDDVKTLQPDQSDVLLLFRRRGDALAASAQLEGRPFRLRMSGLPVCIEGWIARLLWDWVAPHLDRDDFERLWAERIQSLPDASAGDVWEGLVRAFGRSPSRISMNRLVERLASGAPPGEFTLPEFGSRGPVFSTIHGSKGREAGEVRLYLAKSADVDGNNHEEEARIVFVGATRAKSRLQVGTVSSYARSRRLPQSGRAYTPLTRVARRATAQATVEVGSVRDIGPAGLVGVSLYATAQDARVAQARVMTLAAGAVPARAQLTDPDHQWRYALVRGDGNDNDAELLCYLEGALNYDLFAIAEAVDRLVGLGKARPPRELRHLRALGVRTVAIAPGDPAREQLHAPWRDSGLIAAPMLTGYSMAYFR